MRNLYLVRHGQVDFPGGIRRCIGWTDLGIDKKGRRQAEELGTYFQNLKEKNITVFTSPLLRAKETAKLLAGDSFPVCEEDGLKELNMGEWENVPMNLLKKTLESEPKTGEGRGKALIRMKEAIGRILAGTEGDVVCVAHAGINSCFLADLLGSSLWSSRSLPQPYGCFSRIQVDDAGGMEIRDLGIMPKKAPDDRECRDIWDHYHTPDRVRSHCEAVCRQALRMAEKLEEAGEELDFRIIRSAALLHDVMRTESDHVLKGACVLRREGYPAVAEVIRCHHDMEIMDDQGIGKADPDLQLEKAVVYLADKLVLEDREVSLEKRFAESRKRCGLARDRQAALSAHERRYRQAKDMERLIQKKINGGDKE
jgi:putative nucleotidyltransferase with HDIG domain